MADDSSSSGESEHMGRLDFNDGRSSSNDSGNSDTDQRPKPRSNRKKQRSNTVHAVRKCTLCETADVGYRCAQCGNLEYCKDCCVRMHNNRYLNYHRVVTLRDDATIDVESLWRSTTEVTDPSPEMAQPLTIEIPVTSVLHDEYTDCQRCPFHTSIPIDMYCMSCDVPVCSSCGARGQRHEACKLVPINSRLRADQEIIQTRVLQLRDVRDKLGLLRTRLHDEKNVTKQQTNSVTTDITNRINEVRKVLDEAEKQFLDQVNEAAAERNRIIEVQASSVADTMSDVDVFLKDAESVLVSCAINLKDLLPHRMHLLNASTDTIDRSGQFFGFAVGQLDKVRSFSLNRTLVVDPVLMELQRLRSSEADERWQPLRSSFDSFLPPAIPSERSIPTKEFASTGKVWAASPQQPSWPAQPQPTSTPPPVIIRGRLVNVVENYSAPTSRASSPGRAPPPSSPLISQATKDQIKNRIVQQMARPSSPTRVTAPVHNLVRGRSPNPQRFPSPLPNSGPATRSTLLDVPRAPPSGHHRPHGSPSGTRERETVSSPRTTRVDVPGPGAYTLGSTLLRGSGGTGGSRANSPLNKAR